MERSNEVTPKPSYKHDEYGDEPNTSFKDYLFDQRTTFFIEEIKKYKQESLDKNEEIKELKNSNRQLEDQLRHLQDLVTSITGEAGDCVGRTKNNHLLEKVVGMTQKTARLNNQYEQVKAQLKEAVRQLKQKKDHRSESTTTKETKGCQTVKHSVCQTDKIQTESIHEVEDSLVSELFYLPKDPELPDLRLFKNILKQ